MWVANAPDILFLQDTDGDGKADKQEVVVTGFGRDDTHELPNSLTWGPDGWLYGLNGVFNQSHVRSGDQGLPVHLRDVPHSSADAASFELFCEGTSNPWGIAWDDVGQRLRQRLRDRSSVASGRNGLLPPPGRAPIRRSPGSSARSSSLQASEGGLLRHPLSSTATPIRRNTASGCTWATFTAAASMSTCWHATGPPTSSAPAPDFLTANDAWFMPVVAEDRTRWLLYILDWYDRYHCYQDAGRDPAGIDRLKGRLYRVRYKETPRVANFDLARESDDALLARLERAPNDYFRTTIVRLLCERRDPQTRPKLERMTLNEKLPLKTRMRALWAQTGSGPLDEAFHQQVLSHREPALRAWGIRAAGNMGKVSESIRRQVVAAAHDPSADVRLQAAIAAQAVGD